MKRFVLCIAIGGLASAQDWQSEVRALRPADASASEAAVLDEAQQRAKRSLDAIPHAYTRQEADRQRAGLRRRLTESLGVERLPWPPDLQARSAGVLRRPGYRIEKIIYQTLPGVLVAASDYVKAMPDAIDRWLPRPLTALGTDGFGRSETRAALREFFEVDYRYVIVATLAALAKDGKLDASVVDEAIKAHNINPEKSNPAVS